MSSKNIFIHIPKTGGTTINCVMTKSEWQTKPDFNYRHILYETKKSNSADIFNPINYDKYLNYNIFMLLRNPVDRLISEYYFIKDRQEFMSLIKPIPKDINEYIKNKQTNNYMIGFLLGKRMYDEDLVTEDDYELVINTIKNLNIKVGIFEEYAKSLSYFSSITGIKWPKHIDIKRITLNRPQLESIPDDLKTLIIKYNALDYKLYNYCLKEFEEDIKNQNIHSNISFKGNKYNYILKYTERFNLLEIGLDNKKFIQFNSEYFNQLNLYLHNTLLIKDGLAYVKLWNDCFIKTINKQFGDSSLVNRLNSLSIDEPLDKTKELCKILDSELQNKFSGLYKTRLIFNEDLIDINQTKKDFITKLSSLFRK